MSDLNLQNFKKIRLGDVFEIISGQAPLSSSYNGEGEGTPFLRVNCFGKKYPSTKTYTTTPLKTCKKGDILISVAGTLGDINIADKEYAITRSIFALRIKESKIKKMFVFYYLKSLKRALEKLGLGSAQKIITRGSLSELEIPFPNEDVQNKIVLIFETLEHLIDNKQESKILIKNYLKSLYNKLFGDPLKNDKRFKTKKLGEIAKLSMGGTPSTSKKEYWENGNVNWIKSGDIKEDFITETPHKITKLGLKNSNAKLYKKGDVVIALNGQGKTRGTTGILEVETSSNQSVASISPSNEIMSEYLNYNLKFRYNEIRNLTGDQERSGLNLSILRNFLIPIPPKNIQKKFAEEVNKIEKIRRAQKISDQLLLKLYESINRKYIK